MKSLLNKALVILLVLLMVGLGVYFFKPAPKQEIDFSQAIAKSTAHIKEGMAKHKITGMSVALVHGGKIIWAEGFGEANTELHIPAKANTVYMIGSAAKSLTTAGLLTLVDQKLVALDEPAATYLPEFMMQNRFPDQAKNLTVRRLLNHHSGTPGDNYNGAFVESAWDTIDSKLYTDWLFNYLKDDYPTYDPGEIASYNNTGFVLAGEILRKKTGSATFPDAIDATLLKPLGMTHTSFRKITENLAVGYTNGQPNSQMESNITATGGAYSTVEDMSKFLLMLLNSGRDANGRQILSSSTVAEIGQKEISPLDVDSYASVGLGFDTVDDPVMRYAGTAWSKHGSVGFFNAYIEIIPGKDLGVVVLSNSNNSNLFVYSAAREILKNAVKDRYNLAPTQPVLAAMPSETSAEKIAGKYAKGAGYDQIVANPDSTFTWIVDAHTKNPTKRILKFDGTAFALNDGTERIVFIDRPWKNTPHFLMVQYGGSGSEKDNSIYDGVGTYTLAEKFTPQATPDIWRNRTNKTYIIDDLAWNESLFWEAPFIRMSETDGVLMGGGMGAQAVLAPFNDNVAFVVGSVNRGDSSMRVIQEDAREKLVISGFQGYDIAQVPSVAIGDTKTGHIDFHKTAWYRLTSKTAGQQIVFTMEDAPQYRLRLLTESLAPHAEQAAQSESLKWTSKPGVWYLAISPAPGAKDEYKLTVKDEAQTTPTAKKTVR